MMMREAPTEEERQRLRRLRMMDIFCLAVAALIIVLTVLELVYNLAGLPLLEAILLLGALLNVGLAARARAAQFHIAAAGALILAAVCAGAVIYQVVLR